MASLLSTSHQSLVFSGVTLPKLPPLGAGRAAVRFPRAAASAVTPNVKGSPGLRTQLHRRPNLSTVKVQEFSVYEIDEQDRDSPAYLRLMFNKVNSLGDIVSFTNKLYSGDMQTRLGITNGICFVISHDDKTNGDRYEAVFSFYFGDYGQVSVQGPYLTYENSDLAVTGGSGIFKGVSGRVTVEPLALSPSKRFYTFRLKGIADLPPPLLCTALPPFSTVEPAPAAVACQPGSALQNFTD